MIPKCGFGTRSSTLTLVRPSTDILVTPGRAGSTLASPEGTGVEYDGVPDVRKSTCALTEYSPSATPLNLNSPRSSATAISAGVTGRESVRRVATSWTGTLGAGSPVSSKTNLPDTTDC